MFASQHCISYYILVSISKWTTIKRLLWRERCNAGGMRGRVPASKWSKKVGSRPYCGYVWSAIFTGPWPASCCTTALRALTTSALLVVITNLPLLVTTCWIYRVVASITRNPHKNRPFTGEFSPIQSLTRCQLFRSVVHLVTMTSLCSWNANTSVLTVDLYNGCPQMTGIKFFEPGSCLYVLPDYHCTPCQLKQPSLFHRNKRFYKFHHRFNQKK